MSSRKLTVRGIWPGPFALAMMFTVAAIRMRAIIDGG
jgi:hypothetical protein